MTLLPPRDGSTFSFLDLFPFPPFLRCHLIWQHEQKCEVVHFWYTNAQNNTTIAHHRTIRTEAARAPYDFRAEAAETVRFPQDLRTASLRLCPSPSPKARTRNRTLLVYNVNTYAVARSHLQCLKVVRKYPVSILYKSIAGRYRPVRVADGPITARYWFIKNASWVNRTASGVIHALCRILLSIFFRLTIM